MTVSTDEHDNLMPFPAEVKSDSQKQKDYDFFLEKVIKAEEDINLRRNKKRTGPLIIGVNGIAGAGKDTISNMVLLSLQQDHKLKGACFAFADNLKKAASIIFNVPLVDFYDRDKKEVKVPHWDMSPREMAQQLGTEACRRGIRDDIWIKSLQSTIATAEVDVAFVTDVRFDNEAQFVKDMDGVTVNINRDKQEKIATSGHASEAGISAALTDYTVLNVTGNAFVAAAELQRIVLLHLRKEVP